MRGDRGYLVLVAGAIVLLVVGVVLIRFNEFVLDMVGVTLMVWGFGALAVALRGDRND